MIYRDANRAEDGASHAEVRGQRLSRWPLRMALLAALASGSLAAVPGSWGARALAAGNGVFTSAGCSQSFSPPSGVSTLYIQATGAAGASVGSGKGGAGDAYGRVVSSVTSGTSFDVCVDAGGGSGGLGGAGVGGAGGGASGVSLGSDFSQPLLVAGGGGGSGSDLTATGGAAGTPVAGAGGPSSGGNIGAGGAGGNNSAGPGNGGASGGSICGAPPPQTGGNGSASGTSAPGSGGSGGGSNGSYSGGGGGGAGYEGGGGGGAGCQSGGGGGGGTDYCGSISGSSITMGSCILTAGAGTQHAAGGSSGDASVMIGDYLSCPTYSDLVNALATGMGYIVLSCLTTDTISFAGSSAGTIMVSHSVTLDGSHSPKPIIFDGGGTKQLFTVNGGVTLGLNGLTLSNGSSGSGGAVYNDGTLNVTNSTFSHDLASSDGGAIATLGVVNVTNSTFSSDGGSTYAASGAGGAIAIETSANTSASGTVNVSNSTFSSNAAQEGGAIETDNGALTVRNSTFSGNSSDYGGAIFNSGPATVTSSTIWGNSAASGAGAIYTPGNDSITLADNIIANNSGGNCANNPDTIVTDNGYNLTDDNGSSCGLIASTDVRNTNPNLGSLSNNGGPTFTMEPQPGSQAIDKIPTASCPATDQRGTPRPDDTESNCDIGAVETGSAPPTRAVLASFRVTRHGHELVAQWRLASASGVLGFILYAGGHQLNRRLIRVHASRNYVYRTRWIGTGPYRLKALLRDGHEVSVRTR